MEPPVPFRHIAFDQMNGISQQMRQGQPNPAQLQQAGSLGIEDAPRYINVRDRVAIEQKVAVSKVVKKGKQRNEDSDPGHAGRAEVGNGGCLHTHSALCHGVNSPW